MRVPSSRVRPRLRLSWFDVGWAAVSPVLSLFVRDPGYLDSSWTSASGMYCIVAFAVSLCFFWSFGIRDALPSYFSLHDALQVLKAGVCSSLAGTAIGFALTRLDAVPRSMPIIHALILTSGLLAARAVARVYFAEQNGSPRHNPAPRRHILMIGSNHLTSLFINLVQALADSRDRVVAVLDPNPSLVGRAISRVRIVGTPADLESVMDEFQIHGVAIDRVILAGDEHLLDRESLTQARLVCEKRNVAFDSLPQLAAICVQQPSEREEHASIRLGGPFVATGYLGVKRLTDILVSLGMLIITMPLLGAISLLVYIDMGAPVLFWQQRLGARGRTFLLYKFRTLRAPFDRQGRPLAARERLSSLGRLLRTTHLDELPQLFNVLVGDMSLVGPRPLLPLDQPPDPSLRLMVRPGITGWAQINGGKDLSIAAKTSLDEWYVRNISLRVDLSVLGLTLITVLRGGSRETWVGDAALRDAANAVETDQGTRG